MTSAPVLGPAVVVDDKAAEPEGALRDIINQIELAGLPLARMTELPPISTLNHWRRLGLIILDWELAFAGEEGEDLPAGLTVPQVLQDRSREDTYEFIRALLVETYAPIFIISNLAPDTIWQEVRVAMVRELPALERRLHVVSKSAVQQDLFGMISRWLDSRPPLSALTRWSSAYADAEVETFRAFDQASGDWVAIMAEASRADGTEFDDDLREILARNVLNRVRNLKFDPPQSSVDSNSIAGPDLRRVISMAAVIPDYGLPAEFGTGDLFVPEGLATTPYQHIRILISPDCDLARGTPVKLLFLTAHLHASNSTSSKKRVEHVRKGEEGRVFSCVLTADGREYSIKLNAWDTVLLSRGSWPGYRRIGRLMEPYLSNLQQQFALNVTRKGLPRLPDTFFDG